MKADPGLVRRAVLHADHDDRKAPDRLPRSVGILTQKDANPGLPPAHAAAVKILGNFFVSLALPLRSLSAFPSLSPLVILAPRSLFRVSLRRVCYLDSHVS